MSLLLLSFWIVNWSGVTVCIILTIVVKVRTDAEPVKETSHRELLKMGVACALAGISRTTAYAYIRCGAWPAVRIGDRGIRIRRSDLMNWIATLPSAPLW